MCNVDSFCHDSRPSGWRQCNALSRVQTQSQRIRARQLFSKKVTIVHHSLAEKIRCSMLQATLLANSGWSRCNSDKAHGQVHSASPLTCAVVHEKYCCPAGRGGSVRAASHTVAPAGRGGSDRPLSWPRPAAGPGGPRRPGLCGRSGCW